MSADTSNIQQVFFFGSFVGWSMMDIKATEREQSLHPGAQDCMYKQPAETLLKETSA